MRKRVRRSLYMAALVAIRICPHRCATSSRACTATRHKGSDAKSSSSTQKQLEADGARGQEPRPRATRNALVSSHDDSDGRLMLQVSEPSPSSSVQ